MITTQLIALASYLSGENFLGDKIGHALTDFVTAENFLALIKLADRADRALPWIRCEGKFVLSPEDIVAAYPQVKGTG